MKLKEKLAEEYSWTPEQQKHFIAGFEKAREMAREIEWNAAGNSEQLHKFTELGEEEVE